jgi:tetratricopeptide (TPR) repeat protein
MAIAIERYTVVVRNEAIVHRYPGGAEAFMMNVPNPSYCSDHALTRVSFVSGQEAGDFLQELASLGMEVEDGQDAVVCDANEQTIEPSCQWLCLGSYKEATIAWIAGEQVKTIVGPRYWDPEHASDPAKDGQEAFSAAKQLQEQATLAGLYRKAGGLITTHLRTPGAPVDLSASVDIQRAIEQLEIVLDRGEEVWRIHWLIGKGWHALGKSDKALVSLQRALALKGNDPVITRELCGILLELGQSQEAVRLAEETTGNDPLNAELLGNLSAAYLIDGQVTAAQKTVRVALKQAPDNQVNLTLSKLIDEVAEGSRPQPRSLFDLTSAVQE